MASRQVITFDESVKEFVLSAFGMATDQAGFIVEKIDPTKRVLSQDGEEVKACNLAGIRQGSLIFFKSDIPSLIALADRLK